jgi:hypothetical protein
MAGYSGTPLVQKLGIKDGHTVVSLGPMPDGLLPDIPIRKRLGTRADVVLLFTTTRAGLESKFGAAAKAVFPAGMVWVAWPKKASMVATDMTEHVVRDVVLPAGLVDVKVCAIDDVWTGFKIVWRTENRQPAPRPSRKIQN